MQRLLAVSQEVTWMSQRERTEYLPLVHVEYIMVLINEILAFVTHSWTSKECKTRQKS